MDLFTVRAKCFPPPHQKSRSTSLRWRLWKFTIIIIPISDCNAGAGDAFQDFSASKILVSSSVRVRSFNTLRRLLHLSSVSAAVPPLVPPRSAAFVPYKSRARIGGGGSGTRAIVAVGRATARRETGRKGNDLRLSNKNAHPTGGWEQWSRRRNSSTFADPTLNPWMWGLESTLV